MSTLLFILILQGKLSMPCTILQVFLELLSNPSNWYKLALSCPVLSYLSFNQIQSWEFLSYLSLGKDLSWAVLTKFSSDRGQGGAVLSYLSFDQKFELGCPVLFEFRSKILAGLSCPVWFSTYFLRLGWYKLPFYRITVASTPFP